MRTTHRDSDVIDVAFRVIEPARRASTQSDFPLAVLLSLACMLSIGGGTYLGAPVTGMGVAVLLCSLATLTTPSHKHLAPVGFAIALAIGLSACTPAPPPAAAGKDKAAIDASIRAATRYEDPRKGWTPRPMTLPGREQPSEQPKEAGHESR